MVPMDAAWHPPGTGTYQTQSNIINTRESVEEQRKNMMRKLDVDEKGLHNGIKAILLGSRTVTPYWVEKSSVDKFVSLKMKLTALTQAIEEIDNFVGEDMPDDNQIVSEHKTAQKKADRRTSRARVMSYQHSQSSPTSHSAASF